MTNKQKERQRLLTKIVSITLIPVMLLNLTPLQAFAVDYYYAGWRLSNNGSSAGSGVQGDIEAEVNTFVDTENIAAWVNVKAAIGDYIQMGWYNGSGISGTNCGQQTSLKAYLESKTDDQHGGRQCSVVGSVSVGTSYNYEVSYVYYAGGGRYIWYGYLDTNYKGQANLAFYYGEVSSKMESQDINNTQQSFHYNLYYNDTSLGWRAWPGHVAICTDSTHYYTDQYMTNSFWSKTGNSSCE